jgi:hypothetical protein
MRLRSVAVVALGLGLVGGCARTGSVLTGDVTADNAFFVYLGASPAERGTLIASGDAWGTTVKLKPTPLAAGRTYYLHIEAINYGDQAGLIGDFRLSGDRLHFANGRQELLTGTSAWLGDFNNPNSSVTPQSWVAPKAAVASEGANGVGPWGKVADVGAAAQWIWPTDARSAPSGPSSVCGYCTVDFSATITPSRGPSLGL